jgi:CHC2 zinc finger
MGTEARATGGFKATVRGGRIDWQAVRDSIDLADVAIGLLGPAPGRRGERSARRLWWSCPFHKDRNPSFCIKPGGRRWRCWGCGAKGDAIDLVRRLNPGWTFPDAIAYATGQPVPSGVTRNPRNPRNPRPPVPPDPRCPPPARPPARPFRPLKGRRTGRPGCPLPMPWRWSTRPPRGSGRPRDGPRWRTWKAAG